MNRLVLILVALSMSLGACSKPTTIEVDPEKSLISSRNGTVQLKAVVKDQDEKVMPQAKVYWKALTPTIAEIDANGLVTATSSGIAAFMVTSGKATKKFEVSVQIPTKISIDPAEPMLMQGITRRFLAPVLNDREEQMVSIEKKWASSDPEIFTVDQNGNVKTIKEGKATLTVYSAGLQASTTIIVKHEELKEDGTLAQ